MPQQRTHVILPEDLLAEIDTLGRPPGPQRVFSRRAAGRGAPPPVTTNSQRPEPIWKDEDHPELRDGAEAWVRKLRNEDLLLESEEPGDWVERGEPIE